MEEGSEGLPERIVDRLAEMMGGEPTEDDALISAIKDIGRSHEKHLKEKERLQGSNSGEGSGKKHKKRKRGEPSDASAQDSVPAGKKQQAGNSKGSGSRKKGETARFTREQEEEALRVSLRPYEMRGSGRSCKRCGMDNHMWQFCRKEIIVSSTRKKAKKEAKTSKGNLNSKEPKTPLASSVGVQRKAPTNTAGARVVSSMNSRTEGPKRVWGSQFRE